MGTGDLWCDGYNPQVAKLRAKKDYEAVMTFSYNQNFRVPTEPVISVIQQAEQGWLTRMTIEADNVALWRMEVFNQLVQQQTDFNAAHLYQILNGGGMSPNDRAALANGAQRISETIYVGIGNTRWYPRLIDQIEQNIDILQHENDKGWWTRRGVAIHY
jgi:hypothetical protein